MTLKKRINLLVKEISKRECGKVNMDAPQIREVLKTLAVMMAESEMTGSLNGLEGVFYDYAREAHIKRIAARNVKAGEK